MLFNSFFYFFFEFISFFGNFFYFGRYEFFKTFRLSLNILRLSYVLLFFFIVSFINDRDNDFFLRSTFFNWVTYMFIFIVFSLVVFICEEFSTSILEVFFETFFVTWVFLYFPDFFIFGVKCFNNKVNLGSFWVNQMFLPFINLFSGLCKCFILSIRINTNFISGHLLISLFVILLELLLTSFLFSFTFFVQLLFFFIYSIELLISLLQVRVLGLLALTYVKDSTY